MVDLFFRYLLKNQVILALFLIVLGWFILQTRDILVLFFLAYIVMAALLPLVTYLKSKRFPSVLAVIIPYVGVIFILLALIFLLIPFFVQQIQSLLTIFPAYLNHSANIFGFKTDPQKIQNYISTDFSMLGSNALAVTSRVFGGVFSLLTIFIVSFYMLFYHERFQDWVAGFFENSMKQHVIDALNDVDDKLGAWLRGQVILSFCIGLADFIGLSVLGVKYALPLAILGGLLEVVPTLGPILSAVPAIIVALTVSTNLAILVGIVYLIVQILENNLLVPKIMEQAVGLNPILVIFGITVGATLMGIPGALLSVPFISFLSVLFNSINSIRVRRR